MFWTALVFHPEISRSNDKALINARSSVVTELVSHAPTSGLHFSISGSKRCTVESSLMYGLSKSVNSVMPLVSHVEMGPYVDSAVVWSMHHACSASGSVSLVIT